MDFIFSAFIFLVIIITTLTCYFHLKLFNNKDTGILPIPSNPDPYEIAFLKGSTTEVVQLAFLKLIQLDYLQVTGNKIFFKNKYTEDSGLSDLEKYFVDYCTSPRNYNDIFY